jgi:hypothetical protein
MGYDHDDEEEDEIVDVQAILAEIRNDDMATWLGVKRDTSDHRQR